MSASGSITLDGLGAQDGIKVEGKADASGSIEIKGKVEVVGDVTCSGKVKILCPEKSGVKLGGKVSGKAGCVVEGDLVIE